MDQQLAVAAGMSSTEGLPTGKTDAFLTERSPGFLVQGLVEDTKTVDLVITDPVGWHAKEVLGNGIVLLQTERRIRKYRKKKITLVHIPCPVTKGNEDEDDDDDDDYEEESSLEGSDGESENQYDTARDEQVRLERQQKTEQELEYQKQKDVEDKREIARREKIEILKEKKIDHLIEAQLADEKQKLEELEKDVPVSDTYSIRRKMVIRQMQEDMDFTGRLPANAFAGIVYSV